MTTDRQCRPAHRARRAASSPAAAAPEGSTVSTQGWAELRAGAAQWLPGTRIFSAPRRCLGFSAEDGDGRRRVEARRRKGAARARRPALYKHSPAGGTGRAGWTRASRQRPWGLTGDVPAFRSARSRRHRLRIRCGAVVGRAMGLATQSVHMLE